LSAISQTIICLYKKIIFKNIKKIPLPTAPKVYSILRLYLEKL
jgi:hypothetical protein